MKPGILIRQIPTQFLEWQKSSRLRQGRVLHLFENSLNILWESGEVISLVNPDLGCGPLNFVLEIPFHFHRIKDAQTRVVSKRGQIQIDHLAFKFANAGLWDPSPPWQLINIDDAAWAAEQLISGSREQTIPQAAIRFHLPASWNPKSTTQFAEGLAGLGPGLTPSGDDILVGVMHALWANLGSFEAAKISAGLAAAAIPRTTTLSGAWLSAAGLGMAGRTWHRFFSAALEKDAAGLEKAVRQILKTGHTSGADALAGFLSFFR